MVTGNTAPSLLMDNKPTGWNLGSECYWGNYLHSSLGDTRHVAERLTNPQNQLLRPCFNIAMGMQALRRDTEAQ